VLLSLETDGALYQETGGRPIPTGQDGTPLNFDIIATADLPGWNGGPLDWDNARATIGLHQNGGFVFTAATTDWAQGVTLDGSPPKPVDIITANVLTRLRTRQVLPPRGASVDWQETIMHRREHPFSNAQ
jgi:hypothetical protein